MNAELAMEIDRDIMSYVREMQRMAPVAEDAVQRFLTVIRHRRILATETGDRLRYLADSGLLKTRSEWLRGGVVVTYTITANGMDVLDGNVPPPQYRGDAR